MKFPHRIAAGPRQPLRIVAADAETTLYLYDEIGYWGITAEEFVKELAAVSAPVIHLRINSPGGDVFEARAMITALKAHHAKVVAHIDGIAASAASYLALACAEVEIADGAMLMIHRPYGWAMGNADDLRATAAVIDQVEASMLDDYERETGQPRAQVAAWLAAETWFNADDALANGFVDRIAGRDTEPAPAPAADPAPAAAANLAIQNQARRAYLAARVRLASLT